MDDDCLSQASNTDYQTVLVTSNPYEIETFFWTIKQLSMFETMVKSYNSLIFNFYKYEHIYYAPVKITDLIISNILDKDEQERSTSTGTEVVGVSVDVQSW